LTVTDGDGDTNTCWSDITIEDKIGPVAICKSFVTFTLDSDGEIDITPDQIDGGSYDNCGIKSMSLDRSKLDCSMLGDTFTIRLTVEDYGGNINSCWTLANVVDKSLPVPFCRSTVPLVLNRNKVAKLKVADVDVGSYDNCGIVDYKFSKKKFRCTDGGSTQVTMTVTDASGNSDFCEFTVVIADSDCDGIADACDVCPGADDYVDNNNDKIPDCAQKLPFRQYALDWVCKDKKKNKKIFMCKNGKQICVAKAKIKSILKKGGFAGPCLSCGEALRKGNLPVKGQEAHIYPNPTSDILTVRMSDENNYQQLVIYNSQGQEMMNVMIGDDPVLVIDLSSDQYESGIYYLILTSEVGVENYKVLKK